MEHELLKLSGLYGGQKNLSHWAVSYHALGRGDFFHRLSNGKSCTGRLYRRVLSWFSTNWPDGLDWPEDIPRPKQDQGSEANLTQEQERV